jgi:hypothetical protein
MKTKLNPVADLPTLPAYASGALYFLDSGDFLLRYRMEPSNQDCPAPEGSKFVTVRDVQAAFGGAEVDTGWIQQGIIRCGYCAQGDWFAYAAPSKKVEIKIIMDSGRTRKLEVPVPPTLMLGIGAQYFLWAIPASGLTEYSSLYNAPFPNIHDGGLICWGQNTPPAAHHKNAKTAWDLFFASGFNKDLADNKSMKFKDDVRRMLARVARQKLKSYPEEDLVPSRHQRNLHKILEEHGIERSR